VLARDPGEEFSAKEMDAVKRWLVATAERLQR
jgi:hypothetical protein